MRKTLFIVLSALFALTAAAAAMVASPAKKAYAETAYTGTDMTNTVYGAAFASDRVYESTSSLGAKPVTFEAYFRLPAGQTAAGGVLFGNRGASGNAFTVEIGENGLPKVVFSPSGLNETVFDFGQAGARSANGVTYGTLSYARTPADYVKNGAVNLATGNYVLLVIIHDADAQTLSLYIANSLIATFTGVGAADSSAMGNARKLNYAPDGKFRVGGDFTAGNTHAFTGRIKHLSVYSDLRDSDDLLADATRVTGVYPYDRNLLVGYDFTQDNPEYLKDLSSRKNDLTYAGPQIDAPAAGHGMRFWANETYAVSRQLDALPQTAEFEIWLPADYTDEGGLLLNNYRSKWYDSLSFQVGTNGNPQIALGVDYKAVTTITFNANVATGDWVKLAFTFNAQTGEAKCYVNGALVGTNTSLAGQNTSGIINGMPFVLGGTFFGYARDLNTRFFKGRIRNVALFDGVRTAAQISADASGVSASAAGLLGLYDLNAVQNETVVDLSTKKNDIKECAWLDEDEVEPVPEYAYSFIMVGDTQTLNQQYKDNYLDMYDWIVANKESKKIQYVFSMGDVTENNTERQWDYAVQAGNKMFAAGIPYSMVRGNHDTVVGINGAFAGLTSYTSQFGGFYKEGDVCNSWRAMNVCGVDYLMLTLDYGASDDMLRWAGEICDRFPHHRVIVTTHDYEFCNATTHDNGDAGTWPNVNNDFAYRDLTDKSGVRDYNTGEEIWQEFAKHHGNIFLICSGHEEGIILANHQDYGVHGNKVTSMIINPQDPEFMYGGFGSIAIFYFSEDGNTLTVRNYSTVRNQYHGLINQMTIDISSDVKTNHVWEENPLPSNLVTPATATSPAVYERTCIYCGKTETFTYGNPLTDSSKANESAQDNGNAEGAETPKSGCKGEGFELLWAPVLLAAALVPFIVKKRRARRETR